MKRLKWIKFSGNAENGSEDYHPEWIEFIMMILFSPFFWIPLILLIRRFL